MPRKRDCDRPDGLEGLEVALDLPLRDLHPVGVPLGAPALDEAGEDVLAERCRLDDLSSAHELSVVREHETRRGVA